eukprot:CAMPEP_0179116946 /NCGR_PEP_ID=MMETSP0796-20121207/54893_1 /TAXON_ID=73915 /ORGANISM="Pyrodinium bahamense, Strain pbaha01" /LENGTH=185 /DNA_ID=CAMNT_0020815275 /DNA_START=50 /DNA_END=604 /DNA_ORIENTATION=+
MEKIASGSSAGAADGTSSKVDAEVVGSTGQQMQGCAAWQRTSLMIAARHGQLEVVNRFLDTSCSQPQLDVVDEQGNTALMVAAREGHGKVVDALIHAGADVDVRNLEGLSAADLARTDQIREAVKRAEAQVEALKRAIFAGAAAGGSATSALQAAPSSRGSGSAPVGLPAGLAGLLSGGAGSAGA